MTTLEGRVYIGGKRYTLSNGMQAVRMANGKFRVFDNKGSDVWDAGDTGIELKTLRECRAAVAGGVVS
jgi:hypothetical protein